MISRTRSLLLTLLLCAVTGVCVAQAGAHGGVQAQDALVADPTYCTQYETSTYSCRCHSCHCETCYSCGCHVKKLFWQECDYPSCGNSGCWCSPSCKCCRDSDCGYSCNCQQCCDSCSQTVCADGALLTYSVHSLSPTVAPAAGGTPIIVSGGTFAPTHRIECRFDHTVVRGEFLSADSVRCIAPDRRHAMAGSMQHTVAVEVSLDDGASWTHNGANLTFYTCPADCSGHGTCNTDSSCTCAAGWKGQNCSLACPTGAAGAVCAGHGFCDESARCTCSEGYWGDDCSQQCPLGTGGLPCSGSSQGFCGADGRCTCNAGFAGDSCAHVGQCDGAGHCTCEAGYWGSGCQHVCPASSGCQPGVGCDTTCSGHGVCSVDGSCRCLAGYWGALCDNECPGGASHACSGHGEGGSCHPDDGACSCLDGYYGDDCSLVCPGGPSDSCSGRGVCNFKGTCTCQDGFVGDACETACPVGTHGLTCSGHGLNGAFCRPDGECNCQDGYYGAACEQECPGGASNPCSGHGACSDGQCVCLRGYVGSICAEQCPGGADNPCYGHGTCDSNGGCHCLPDYWGSTCENLCPGAPNATCNNAGSCDPATGACHCSSGWRGATCDVRYCPFDCHGHGECEDGVCVCFEGWQGTFCSTQAAVPPSVSILQFQPADYYVREDSGTVMVNVSRLGSLAGDVVVHYATVDGTALAVHDFVQQAGSLSWTTGDNRDKSIFVELVDDRHPEAAEQFTLVLSSPSAGAQLGDYRTATIHLPASDNDAIDDSSVEMRLHLLLPLNSTSAEELFKAAFIADLAEALQVDSDRLLLEAVILEADGEYVVFYILPPLKGADDQRPAPALADMLVRMIQDPESALFQGTVTRFIDVSYVPRVTTRSADKPQPAPAAPTNSIGAASIFLIVLLIVCVVGGAVAFYKRRQLSQWLLWKLGGFRFNALHEGGLEDSMELGPPAKVET
eukprot:PLAT8657.1.p1 GENE.PLAT8657.1~~PLAT8657.1.p1  ORF type:complete len:957 (+),score=349.10 PLAT8657.1:516-3386(+)